MGVSSGLAFRTPCGSLRGPAALALSNSTGLAPEAARPCGPEDMGGIALKQSREEFVKICGGYGTVPAE